MAAGRAGEWVWVNAFDWVRARTSKVSKESKWT